MSAWVYCGRNDDGEEFWALPFPEQSIVSVIVQIGKLGEVYVTRPFEPVTIQRVAGAAARNDFSLYSQDDDEIVYGSLSQLVEDLANLLATVRSCGR